YRVFVFQAKDGIRDRNVTGVQTCALPISRRARAPATTMTVTQTKLPMAPAIPARTGFIPAQTPMIDETSPSMNGMAPAAAMMKGWSRSGTWAARPWKNSMSVFMGVLLNDDRQIPADAGRFCWSVRSVQTVFSEQGQALIVEPRKSSASLLRGHLSGEGDESFTVGVRDIESREDSDEGTLDD